MMESLFPFVRPVLHALEPERAHNLTLLALKSGLYHSKIVPSDPRLSQTVWGITFPNPVGLSAGFDKNAEALDGILSFGFGFIEAGSVTPRPQYGNPKPRVFRDPASGSVINRIGMANRGAAAFDAAYDTFRARGAFRHGVVGINIAKNKDTEDPAADYVALIRQFGHKADYISINISSPNTVGLRDLQAKDTLAPLLQQLVACRNDVCKNAAKNIPLLVKLAPDLDAGQCADIAQTLMDAGIDGLILSNTTLARPETLPASFRAQTGGLSGPHVRAPSTDIIRLFYKLTGGRIPIIGVGGIDSGAAAYEKIRAGASLVELYTALIYQGPGLVRRIQADLLDNLVRDGFSHISHAIGADHK